MHFYSFSEILRIIDSVQMTDLHKVATPVDWKVRVLNCITKYETPDLQLLFKFPNNRYILIRSATNAWFCQPLKMRIALAFFQKALRHWRCHPANAIYAKHHIRHPINRKLTDFKNSISNKKNYQVFSR